MRGDTRETGVAANPRQIAHGQHAGPADVYGAQQGDVSGHANSDFRQSIRRRDELQALKSKKPQGVAARLF
jgi:hypothetical protein